MVGKGAAALLIAGGAAALHADVASRPALELLRAAGIPTSCGAVVRHIVNRAGDGICPVERLCAAARTAEECLPLIEGFLLSMKKSDE